MSKNDRSLLQLVGQLIGEFLLAVGHYSRLFLLWLGRKLSHGYNWVRTHSWQEIRYELLKRAKLIALISTVSLILLGLFWLLVIDANIPKTRIVVVNGADVKRIDGQDTYLIFTDIGEFKNVDEPWRLKWHSAKIQNVALQAAKTGKKMQIRYHGRRITWWSQFPNVTSATIVE